MKMKTWKVWSKGGLLHLKTQVCCIDFILFTATKSIEDVLGRYAISKRTVFITHAYGQKPLTWEGTSGHHLVVKRIGSTRNSTCLIQWLVRTRKMKTPDGGGVVENAPEISMDAPLCSSFWHSCILVHEWDRRTREYIQLIQKVNLQTKIES